MSNKFVNYGKSIYHGIINVLRHDIYGSLINAGICSRKHYGKIRKFKNIYEGEKCFIIGSGPSLTLEDLTSIAKSGDFKSITCNSVFKAYELTDWRADIYCVGDAGVWETVGKQIIALHPETPIIVRDAIYNVQSKEDKEHLVPVNVRSNIDYPKRRRFSANAARYTYRFGSVLYFMIQLAVYMGFKEIYLVGCDCNYSYTKMTDGSVQKTGDKDYFLPDYEDRKAHQPINQFDVVIPDYDEARRFCDAHGIKVYNATRGGKLESFERVNIDDLFNK